MDIISKPYLILHVRKKWFDLIKTGEKNHEFRIDSEYWRRRLCGPPGRVITYDLVLIACGYPKRKDPGKWLAFFYVGYYPCILQNEEFGPDLVKCFGIPCHPDKRTELPPGWI